MFNLIEGSIKVQYSYYQLKINVRLVRLDWAKQQYLAVLGKIFEQNSELDRLENCQNTNRETFFLTDSILLAISGSL